ncbi:hypothetical protein HYZ41_02160 [archaeon]|nr:hypothetical protein [archaeon]
MNKIDMLLVGHYTQDIIITADGKKHEKQGGPPSYMTPFLKTAEINFRIISKIGKDFRYTHNLYNPITVCDTPSTCWFADYTKAEVMMKFLSVCESIKPEEIKDDCTIALACGCANEIPQETILKMRNTSKFLLCDIQGFCRRTKEDGTIFYIDPMKDWFNDYAHLFDFIKISLPESKIIDIKTMKKKTNVIITKGGQGCTIIPKNDKPIDIPTIPLKEDDPTGAGDAFLAGFAYGLLKNKSMEECCRMGNFFGGLAVKHIGVPKVTKEDLKNILSFK